MKPTGVPIRPEYGVRTIRWTPLGETAIVVEFGDRIDREILHKVWNFGRYLDRFPMRGMVEYVTAFTTVTIFFDPLIVDVASVGLEVERVVPQLDLQTTAAVRMVEIPVCYGEEFGPDLEFIARHNGLTVPDVIELHAGAEYLVYLIGFAPGFPYLGGMSPRIAAPRLDSPRLSVPAGSVGIAGEQTGIYPIGTPGGWRLIGRTPLALFRPADRPPWLLCAGDAVQIRPITRDEFRAWPAG
jgi:inhibitor of KinA